MAMRINFERAAWLLLVCTAAPALPAAPPPPRTIEVSATRFSYSPAEITLKKGEPVVLELTSVDVPHGLKFPELHLNTKVAKGAKAQLSFVPDKAGTFVGRCSVFCGLGHGSMKLTLHVVE